ncbi:MAG: hypothetical protein D3913_01985 [Candidatus Electrothrix sp. LOE1_4_5]|nr:hypothetical protein [Candidatus Electrothrix gigas]
MKKQSWFNGWRVWDKGQWQMLLLVPMVCLFTLFVWAGGACFAVVLDQPNLKGTVGLTDIYMTLESHYKVSARWSGGSIESELSPGDSNFALRVELGYPVDVTVSAYINRSHNVWNYVTQSIRDIPALEENEERSLDLIREGGFVRSKLNVTGGQVKWIEMRTSAEPNSTEYYSGYTGIVTCDSATCERSQPVPALPDTRVFGTASVVTDSGCARKITLSTQTVDVPVGETIDVTWSSDLNTIECSGSIQGNVSFLGVDGDNEDATPKSQSVFLWANPSVYYYALVNPDGSYFLENIPSINYSVKLFSRFNDPPYRIALYSPGKGVSVKEGETTVHDIEASVGTLHGTINPKGLWTLSDLSSMSVDFSSSSSYHQFYDGVDLSTGMYDLVSPVGTTRVTNLGPRFYKKVGSRYVREDYEHYYRASPVQVTIEEGDRFENRDIDLETSASDVEFHLINGEGEDVGIRDLTLKGSERTSLAYKRIDLSAKFNTGSATATDGAIIPVWGTPGVYEMNVVADGDDGGTYSKDFKLELTSPQYAEIESNVFLEFTAQNDEPIASVTFANVSEAGYTAINRSTTGPRPQENFKVHTLHPTINSEEFYDIRSTAVFDEAMVCFGYDDSSFENSNQEKQFLKIVHYVCADKENRTDCEWEDLDELSWDTEKNIICGKTLDFSIFAVVEALIRSYTVVSLSGTGGSISPDSSQSVEHGDMTNFTLIPNTGYGIDTVEGCNGSLNGNVYTTGAITGDCAVTARFVINTYKVTPSAGEHGSINPDSDKTVDYGQTTIFTVTPDTGYSINKVEGCGGTLSGNTYTTGAITGDCEVTASFVINKYTVTPSAGANGSISPNTPQTVDYGNTTSFTLTPDTGYGIDTVEGCNGSLNGNVYTTGAITGDCTVTASFITAYPVIPKARKHGSISPSMTQQISEGHTTCFTITPDADYSIKNVHGCDGALTGNVYTTGPITQKCKVRASFKKKPVVTAKARRHGSIAPSGRQTVNEGTVLNFTVTPDAGYTVKKVRGCGGTLSGNVYTTKPIDRKCKVRATFTRN